MFTEVDLTSALTAASSKVSRKMSAYLIGGCAMTFMGRKVATKDIDIVFSSMADAKDFVAAMELVGFAHVQRVATHYTALGAFAIMEDAKGMRFDIFDRQVCRALELSEGMRSRAHLYKTLGNLAVYLMSPEDIFLFKGITEREADLDDMRMLAEVGLNWSTIEKECLSQQKSGRWAYMLGTKLLDLRAKFWIDPPIIRTLLDHADLDLVIHVFESIIAETNGTFKEIAQAVKAKYKYSDSWTRKQLRILTHKQVVAVRNDGRRYVFSIKKRSKS